MAVPGRCRLRHVVSVTLLVSILPLAGCFGDVQAVYVPESDRAAGWSHAQENQTESVAGGELKLVLNEYRYKDEVAGRILLLAATNVPVVSETEILRDYIDDFARENGVEMTKKGSSSKTLSNGVTVNVDEYEITKREGWGDAKGKAWIMTHDAGDFFFGGVGFATTEYKAAGILGTGGLQQDASQWRNVQDMMLEVDW